MDNCFIRQFVVSLRGFDEFPSEVEHSGIAHLKHKLLRTRRWGDLTVVIMHAEYLIVNLQLFIRGLVLKQ